MVGVAVGWQVYAIHGNPLDLGLVGLAEFIPLLLVALPAGQLADRMSRRLLFAASIAASLVVTLALLAVTLAGASTLAPFLIIAALGGAAVGIGNGTARTLPPELVPPALLPSAMALRSTVNQVGILLGPVLGGVLFAISPAGLYVVAAVLLVLALLCTLALHRNAGARGNTKRAASFDDVLDGIRFLRRSRVVLGAILLDLVAVLLGGAVALLPAYAATILHVGPAGLGFLRSAPAVGALVMGIAQSRRPSMRRIGPTLISAIVVFGAATVVFGLSRSFPLSFAALVVTGAADMVSVNIRGTAVALATPNELRGRVTAVESVFLGASNQLGAFESGATATLMGLVPAVVFGGVATIGVALVWIKAFPELALVDDVESLAYLAPDPDG